MAQVAFSQFFTTNGGNIFVAICLLFFAFSTILSWNLFAKLNWEYLFGKKTILVFACICTFFVFLGAVLKIDLVWELQDMFNQLMVLPNAIALFALTGSILAIANAKHDKKATDVRAEHAEEKAWAEAEPRCRRCASRRGRCRDARDPRGARRLRGSRGGRRQGRVSAARHTIRRDAGHENVAGILAYADSCDCVRPSPRRQGNVKRQRVDLFVGGDERDHDAHEHQTRQVVAGKRGSQPQRRQHRGAHGLDGTQKRSFD